MFDYKVWDYWADKYDKLWVQKYSLTPTRQMILRELHALLPDGGKYRVLDVGCGTGQLLREMQQQFAGVDLELTGIDISLKMIEEAKRKSSGISYYCKGVEELADGAVEYDLLVCTHSFPYYPDKMGVIARFAGLVKPGGYLLMAQASENTLYDHLVMPFVKFTTSKAQYPSVKVLNPMLLQHFATVRNVLIKEKFYMPSIYLFVAKTCLRGDG